MSKNYVTESGRYCGYMPIDVAGVSAASTQAIQTGRITPAMNSATNKRSSEETMKLFVGSGMCCEFLSMNMRTVSTEQFAALCISASTSRHDSALSSSGNSSRKKSHRSRNDVIAKKNRRLPIVLVVPIARNQIRQIPP